jgi:hypothetical protein
MKVSPVAQRELRPGWVSYLTSRFDTEKLGLLVLSERDGVFYIIDGQHRRAALIAWLGLGWETQEVQCEVYVGLTEAEEADLFDALNDTKTVSAFDRFRVRVTAEHAVETDIQRVVEVNGQHISRSRSEGISAVHTLTRVYRNYGPDTLGRAVRIIDGAFGLAGFDAPIIDGVGMLGARYNGELDEQRAIARLGNTRRGVAGLLERAEQFKLKTHKPLSFCVAAAAVEVINSGSGPHKLPNWWAE